MDNKVIVINPLDEENGLTDGDINYIGEIDSYFDHSELLINYGVDAYGEKTIFDIMSTGNYLVEYPVYFLTEEYDNIVFLNVSNSKTGKIGLLYLPSDISDKQRESLLSLSSVLKDFNIEVNYNLRLDDGIVDYDMHSEKGIDGIVSKDYGRQKKA